MTVPQLILNDPVKPEKESPPSSADNGGDNSHVVDSARAGRTMEAVDREKAANVACPRGAAWNLEEDACPPSRPLVAPSVQDACPSVVLDLVLPNDEEKTEGGGCRCRTVAMVAVKLLGVLSLLYVFICSLDLLGSAFKILGGKTAGSVFRESELLQNPITGMMIGVLSTVLLQSSSTSTSIIVTMVSSGILDVRPAVPIVMGANIGTTVTNTMVSLAHSGHPREFRRAFSGATVHDVFNWLTVLILLPLEAATGYLYRLTGLIVKNVQMGPMKGGKQDLLKKLTKPLTKLIIQIDKKVISEVAEGDVAAMERPIVKTYCKFRQESQFFNTTTSLNGTDVIDVANATVKIPTEKCGALFSQLGWGDKATGAVLLVASLVILTVCLICVVKLLHSMLRSKILAATRRTLNADFPGRLSWLTGYVAIVVGALLTMVVQSSSVFTSALTPLVGVGCLKLERMYPLTLGSNIGTTATGILAALAAPADKLASSLQVALCHLFFNISGILLFYPIPALRRLPLRAARMLGRTTARYRWFAVLYLLSMFVLLPGTIFGLSMAGKIPFFLAVSLALFLGLVVVLLNVAQRRIPHRLPVVLRSWKFLPEPLRSLAPYDRLLRKLAAVFARLCCCQRAGASCDCLTAAPPSDAELASDSEESSAPSSLPSSRGSTPESSRDSSRACSRDASCISLASAQSTRPLLGVSLHNGKIYRPVNRHASPKPASPAHFLQVVSNV